MTTLGTSFTRWRAEDLGLDYRQAFRRVLGMAFALIRLSASWEEISRFGWTHLDWLMDAAAHARQAVVLTVGMKALGWPEFYLPAGLDPASAGIQSRLMAHVRETVERYCQHPTLQAWQIENEPFNRSGPQARWIARALVRREAAVVRSLDARRPQVITTFGHFSADLDRASSRHQADWRRRLRLDIPAEREALAVLRRGDILGVDIYRAIGWRDKDGVERISRADGDQPAWIQRWQRIARRQGKQFWVTEAQAEPWEASPVTRATPRSVAPDDIRTLLEELVALEVETVLLWGSEYWLWREDQGDRRWIDAVTLGRQALARSQP